MKRLTRHNRILAKRTPMVLLKEVGYSLVPKHHSQSHHLLGLQDPEEISFPILQKVGSMSQGDLAVLFHQQSVTAMLQSSGHSLPQLPPTACWWNIFPAT